MASIILPRSRAMRRGMWTSTRGCSDCGWSRRRSTRTTRPSIISFTPMSTAAPAQTSPSSNTRGSTAARPERSRAFLERTLGFGPAGTDRFDVRGEQRGSFYAYDRTAAGGRSGAGTVHHVAWASPTDDHPAWRERVVQGGGRPTPIIDRFYFRSIYFREPSGVLFEIATLGPGFATDEPLEHLGEGLSLPPAFEHMRTQLERV